MKASSSRRQFLKSSALMGSALALGAVNYPTSNNRVSSSPRRSLKSAPKVVVLGMDGLDPQLLRRFMQEGILPTFSRFIESNHFSELQTTMPPQSPVAWSSFISGTNPGGHGIFDFVHRDPKAFLPYLSTSRSFDSKKAIKFGGYKFSLSSGSVELLRHGKPLWSYLEERDIPACIFQIPGNFPIVESASYSVSGMGTPDLLGSYGTCTYFTDNPSANVRSFEGGRVVRVKAINHLIKCQLEGVKNPFIEESTSTELDIEVRRDPWEAAAKINLDQQEILLKQGEWSDWLPIRFQLIPMFSSVAGMVRIYLKSVHPYFEMYVSPVNIDPAEPSLPICGPTEFGAEITDRVGRFYTQGLPADTKALANGLLSDDEYLSQAKLILHESLANLDYTLKRFDEGLLFFYFSSPDQNSHMLWRNMDPTHPLYRPDASPDVKDGVRFFYRGMDQALRMALEKIDNDTTLIVLSDHGFAPFSRELHLSTWLFEQGFTALTSPDKLGQGEFYRHVDWDRTKAYALGINGIYINQKGREKNGSVDPQHAQAIKNEILAKLIEIKDPLNGNLVVARAYDREKLYHGPFMELAPDILVGYQRGYRVSDEGVLGKFPKEVIADRTNKWAADHCMEPSLVPGVLLSNRRCTSKTPAIWDMAPSILKIFGIDTPASMDGRSIFEV